MDRMNLYREIGVILGFLITALGVALIDWKVALIIVGVIVMLSSLLAIRINPGKQ